MFGRKVPPTTPVESKSGPIPDTPGPYELDPNHYHTQLPAHKPGTEYWPGVQLDNGVTELIQAMTYVGFDPYRRTQQLNSRILQSSGGHLVSNPPGPVLVDAIEQLMQ